MSQTRLDLCLAVKPLYGRGIAFARGEHFNRNDPAEMSVCRLINLTHSARAKKFRYAVLANQLIQKRGHKAASPCPGTLLYLASIGFTVINSSP